MKYGFLTLCFDREIRTGRMGHDEIFKWASESDFEGVEIYLPTLPDLSWRLINQIRKSLEEYDLSVSQVSHATQFLCLDPKSKSYCKRYYSLAAEIASTLEAPYLRATSGFQVADKKAAVALASESLSDLLDLADSYRLFITLENHPGVENAYNVLSGIFQRCKSRRLRFNFDTVNSLTVGEDPIKILKEFSDLLVHAHACDAAKENYHEKTVIGKGSVPWKEIMKHLKAINYAGFLSIEYFGEGPHRTLIESREYLKRLEAM